MYNRFNVARTLVVAPKKVAEGTWSKESAKWEHLSKLRINLVLGTERKRISALNSPGDIWVINRENVRWLVEHLRDAWNFDMVIIDESSSFKNHRAKRFKYLTWVRRYIKRMVLLTGTPAPNGVMDLWAQLYLLDEGARLGKNITGFRDRYFDAALVEGWCTYDLKPGASNAVHTAIGDICVSMSAEDYLELPDCIHTTVPIVLDAVSLKAYRKLERTMILEMEDATIDASTAAVLSNKLLQLCNGAVYDADKGVHEVHKCKVEAFVELVEALDGKPVIVFYNFKHDLDRIHAALKDFKIEDADGHKRNLVVKELKGQQEEKEWNERKIEVLLAHPASCAYGLNLQDGGNHVVWFGLNWSLELYQQANKRLHRQGQKEKVIIHHLVVEGGLDEDVAAALEHKGNTQGRIMDALKARIERTKLYGKY